VLACDRGAVHDERVAVLRPGDGQQVRALPVEERDGAQVRRELDVELAGRDLRDRLAHADAGVVHEDVETVVALAVRRDDAEDVLLVAEVGGDRHDVHALGLELRPRGLELLRPARGDRQGVALLPEQVGEREPDAARRPRHDRCTLRH
jgi:hypothetical protein